MPGPSHSTRMLHAAWRSAAKCTCYSANGTDRRIREPWYKFSIEGTGLDILVDENGNAQVFRGGLQEAATQEVVTVDGQAFYQVNSSLLNGIRIVFQLNGNGVELFRLLKEEIEA